MFHYHGLLWPKVAAVVLVFAACAILFLALRTINRARRWLVKKYTYSPMHDIRLNLIGTTILFVGAICWEQIGLPAAILLGIVGLVLYVSSNLESRA